VVTSAPRLDVVDTDNELALVIAASKSRAPVIPIAPSAPSVPPPTALSNSTSEVPTLIVKSFASVASEFTVPVKVICELVVVRVMSFATVTFPV
jgi:hypothetical protein